MKWLLRLPRLARFLVYYVWEIILSNLKVAYDIVTPDYFMKPGVVAVPLTVKSDFQIFLVANFITMTPGTLSMDVSNDKKTLYVHAMYIDDETEIKQSLKNGIEAAVIRLFAD
ncbi:MAG: Na+/H+ antiporter subunit E [Verrucomicrobiota bacterium]